MYKKVSKKQQRTEKEKGPYVSIAKGVYFYTPT
jgi:hypothetical protein